MGFRIETTGALLAGAVSIAAVHALIPSHWLSFAVVGRAQRWTLRRTLATATLAGAGHILMTTALGFGLAAAGKAALHVLPEALEHLVTAGSLILLGLYFAFPALRGRKGCQHPHHQHQREEAEEEAADLARTPDQPHRHLTTISTLVLGMTLSPCLDMLPVYVAASTLSWSLILGISLTMAVTTLGLTALLVWLTAHGLQRLNLRWLERNEGVAVGGVLIALGILLFFL